MNPSSIRHGCRCVKSLHVVPVVTHSPVQTSGRPLWLDLTVRSIRCLELSPGRCPLEALWRTLAPGAGEGEELFRTRKDSESG